MENTSLVDPSYLSIRQRVDDRSGAEKKEQRKEKLRRLLRRSKETRRSPDGVVFVLSRSTPGLEQEEDTEKKTGGNDPTKLYKTVLNVDWSLKRMEQRRWAIRRNANPGQYLTLAEAHYIRQWFNSLDADGSGEIAIEELADPLLIANIALTEEQTIKLFRTIDADQSGEVDFEEFLAALSLKSKFTHKSGILSVLEDLETKFGNMVCIETAMNVERRKFILDTLFNTSSEHCPQSRTSQRGKLKEQKKYAALRRFVFDKEEIKYRKINGKEDSINSIHWNTRTNHQGDFGSTTSERSSTSESKLEEKPQDKHVRRGYKMSKVSRTKEQTLGSLVLPTLVPKYERANHRCAAIARAGNPKREPSGHTDVDIIVGKAPIGQREPVCVSTVVTEFSRFLNRQV